MSDEADGLTALKVEFAEFRGELRTEFKNLAHDVRNLTQKMDAQAVHFVPRKEIEAKEQAQDRRLEALETNQSRAAWAIIGAWIAGVGAVVTFFSKIPH